MNKLSHSQLAMKEARRIARSRSKKKSSRIICHHLLQMLAEEEPPRDAQVPRRPPDRRGSARQISLHFTG